MDRCTILKSDLNKYDVVNLLKSFGANRISQSNKKRIIQFSNEYELCPTIVKSKSGGQNNVNDDRGIARFIW